jgi:3-phytase
MKIFSTVNIVLALYCMASCNSPQNSKKSKKDVSTTETIIHNKEAREDSIKMAKALALQAKVDNITEADYETVPVKSKVEEDAADDPAIWINKADPQKSLIIGTNKKAGLNVYSLHGDELQFLEIGKINNADVSYNFRWAGQETDIVAGSNRSYNRVDLLAIDRSRLCLTEQPICTIPSSVDDVYGLCLYHDTQTNKHYVFVNGKNGGIEQWYLNNTKDSVRAELARTLMVSSQPEGMVVDPVTNLLYVGVEEEGIFKFKAQADEDTTSIMIASSSSENNEYISYDIEGLAIYRISDNEGFLIASIQGSFSYAVFDLTDANNYLTSFIVKDGKYDGIEETDGIDVSSTAMGHEFPKGIFVAQDGFNKDGNKNVNQNFKIVSFEKILPFLKDSSQ